MNTEKKVHYGIKNNPSLVPGIKDFNMAGRQVDCVYNTYKYIDDHGDVLMPGCAKRSIKNNGPNSTAVAKIKHLLFHDLERPTGKITRLEEVTEDNVVTLQSTVFFPDTTDGNDTLKNYEAAVYDNHSIGFNYLLTEFLDRDSKGWDKAVEDLMNPDDAVKRGYMWRIKELQLWEGSTVSFGANRLTPCLGIKDGAPMDRIAMVYTRMDRIAEAIKGKPTDEARHGLYLQMQQLKQVIEEIMTEDVDPRGNAAQEAPRESCPAKELISAEGAAKFRL